MREKIYFLLAKDEDAIVRRALAENPYISEAIQEILAEDSDLDVLTALSFNQSLSIHLSKNLRLQELKEKFLAIRPDGWYKTSHVESPSIALDDHDRLELFEHATRDALIILAFDDNLTEDDQFKVAQLSMRNAVIDGKQYELYSYAKVALLLNKMASIKTMQLLQKSKDIEVLKALVANRSCPDDFIEKLLKRKNLKCYIANPSWFEPPLFFANILERFTRGGLDALISEEKSSILWYQECLESYNKKSVAIKYKLEIINNGGVID